MSAPPAAVARQPRRNPGGTPHENSKSGEAGLLADETISLETTRSNGFSRPGILRRAWEGMPREQQGNTGHATHETAKHQTTETRNKSQALTRKSGIPGIIPKRKLADPVVSVNKVVKLVQNSPGELPEMRSTSDIWPGFRANFFTANLP
jgi:hypothetical protein